MAKVLILFSTWDGQAGRVARRIAAVLEAEGHEPLPIDLDRSALSTPLDRVDAVVVGGSVHMGKHRESLVRFCKEHRAALRRVPSAFFSVSLSAARVSPASHRKVARAFARFVEETGWVPQRLLPVAGALLYTKYPLPTKVALFAISAMAGGDLDITCDHEYTDWAAIERFARDFSATLDAAASADGRGAKPPVAAHP